MDTALEYTKRLADLLRIERGITADFLLALADFDRRKPWRQLDHTSLFNYLHFELKLSRSAAHARWKAAELIQTFPEVEAAIRAGKLCLSTVAELARVLTAENRAEVLPRFFGLSRREAELVAASILPVKIIPTRTTVTAVRPAGAPAVVADPDPTSLSVSARRTGFTRWTRAGGRCEFVLASGERCGCTRRLEFDHLDPVALGGRALSADDLRLCCREHNQLAARRVFGDAAMDRYARARRFTSSG